jgi:hypothetical protein
MHREKTSLVYGFGDPVRWYDHDSDPAAGRRKSSAQLPDRQEYVQACRYVGTWELGEGRGVETSGVDLMGTCC